MGGQSRCRDEWARYTRGCTVILFVVDLADLRRIDQSRKELHRLLENSELNGVPLLVVGNKIDLEPHIAHNDLIKVRACLHFTVACVVIFGRMDRV